MHGDGRKHRKDVREKKNDPDNERNCDIKTSAIGYNDNRKPRNDDRKKNKRFQ